MNNEKSIFVVLGVDSHLDRITKCIQTIKAVYGTTAHIGVATFGNETVGPSVKLKQFCEENDYLFHDCERQSFLTIDHSKTNQGFITTDREFHVCELLGNITVSKHFYDLGYKEVYLLHNDLFVVRDFLPLYRKHMTDNWAFVAPYVCASGQPKVSLESIMGTNKLDRGGRTMVGNRWVLARVTQTVLLLNPKLIDKLFSKYGDQENIFKSFLSTYNMHGDIALLQLFDGFEGFVGNPIFKDTVVDTYCLNDTRIERIIADENLTHVHGDVLYKRYYDVIDDVIRKISEDKNATNL